MASNDNEGLDGSCAKAGIIPNEKNIIASLRIIQKIFYNMIKI